MEKIERYIACYDKSTSQLVKKITIPDVPLVKLSEAIGRIETDIKEDPLLYYDYPINETNLKQLQFTLSITIPIEAFSCYLECTSKTE